MMKVFLGRGEAMIASGWGGGGGGGGGYDHLWLGGEGL